MVTQRPNLEARSVLEPLRMTFRSSAGVKTVQTIASHGFTQVTDSYRTAIGLSDIDPSNRQEYNTFLANNGYRNKFDTGHPFSTEKRTISYSHPSYYGSGTGQVFFSGPLVPNHGLGDYLPVPAFDHGAAGSQLIKKAIPTTPMGTAAVSLGEFLLPGGIPKAYTKAALEAQLKKSAKSKKSQILSGAHAAGDAYLNYVFGYAPIVSDIANAVRTVREGNKFIEQLRRDSGRLVRRQRSLPSISTQSGPTAIASGTGLMSLLYNSSADRASLYPDSASSRGTLTMEESSYQEIYFHGGFQFYFETPKSYDESVANIMAAADKLTGAPLTAERIYQLTPWSWFVDWNSSMGDVISNAQRFTEDGLVMRYGYVMRKTVTNRIYTLTGVKFKNSNPGPISVTKQIIRKERFRGNPFGFGATTSYTSRQWAVLASLGMTGGTGTTVRGR